MKEQLQLLESIIDKQFDAPFPRCGAVLRSLRERGLVVPCKRYHPDKGIPVRLTREGRAFAVRERLCDA